MCMIGRTVLIHGEARKNKSYRKKYFVLNIGQNYSAPRLDYFSNIDKWNQYKDEIHDNGLDSLLFRTIDLSNLFYVDDTHRSKPKHGGLDLYMEDRHFIIVLSSDEVKKKWKEAFENVIYKNGKVKFYPKIEHTLQVDLRLKPKENIDKLILLQWKGDFRVCFMKTSLMFVKKSLENSNLTIQYQSIRLWESRYDGSFRLEIGRAALIGECSLILQLSDYAESKAAHAMLTECINLFKTALPEPPRVVRRIAEKSSDRNSSISYCRKSSLSRMNSASVTTRSDSCMGFSRDSYSIVESQIEPRNTDQDQEDNNYMPMNMTVGDGSDKSLNVQNYLEHISRIFKCPSCGYFTKVVTFCSRCTSSSSANSLRMLFQTEALPNALKTKLVPSVRGKAQSLTERPSSMLSSIRTSKQKQLFSDPTKMLLSRMSQSSDSKTSTNDMSSNSKLESQNSLSISANRHDDEIFMELDFDNLEPKKQSQNEMLSNNHSQMKCGKCCANLVHKRPGEFTQEDRCSKCSNVMVSLTMLLRELDCSIGDWIPRTTSLIPGVRPPTDLSDQSEYVEVNHNSGTK